MIMETVNSIDIASLRNDFPILQQTIKGKPLVYLDNAATSQKPTCVIEALDTYYKTYNANVHRAVHTLGEKATHAYENARHILQKHINARSPTEIIFVRGTTEAINLVANTYGLQHLKPKDEILITHMEHHSNIVPWQLLCEKTGAVLKIAPINLQGEIILEDYKKCLTDKTKIVAFTHISNALGTINPIKEMTRLAHDAGAVVLIDGAQGAAHSKVDVQAIDCDFYTISAHKTYGPTGIGILYGKEHLLNAMPPFHGGGEMIERVTFEKSTYAPLPHKFEAGTPAIAEAIAFGTAIQYLNALGLERLSAYEKSLLQYATEQAESYGDIRLIGTAREKASILSFTLENIHPHDVGTILSHEGIAVRTGHHCAMPLMDFFQVPATTRASFAFYNTKEEIDALFQALEKVRRMFR